MITPNGGVFGRNPKFNTVTTQGGIVAGAASSIAGNLTLSSGNVVLSSGNGISFAATADPTIAAVAATGTITRTATNVSDGDTVTLGAQVYTFKTTLTPADYEVLIGADAAGSLTNLANAINGTGGTPGTDYQVPAANASASAGTIVGSTLPLTALTAGTAGNSIALVVTTAAAAWTRSAATLLGGRAAQGATGELLNDYEEGTWSPRFLVIGGSSQIVSQSVDVLVARYVKIGKLVYIHCWIRTTNFDVVTTGSSRIGITSLPYTVAGTSNEAQSLVISQTASWVQAPRGAVAVPGTATVYFTAETIGTATIYQVATAFTAGTTTSNLVSLSGCYESA